MNNYNSGVMGLVSMFYFRKWISCKELEKNLGKTDDEVNDNCKNLYHIYIYNKNLLLNQNEILSKNNSKERKL